MGRILLIALLIASTFCIANVGGEERNDSVAFDVEYLNKIDTIEGQKDMDWYVTYTFVSPFDSVYYIGNMTKSCWEELENAKAENRAPDNVFIILNENKEVKNILIMK